MNSTEQSLSLEARIRVLENKTAEQSKNYDKMQNKLFALVGLLLTLGGLVTYDIFQINMPDTVLEWIIFIAALALIGITVLLIGYDYRVKTNWDVPIGPVEEEKLDNAKSSVETLTIIHDDYKLVYQGRKRATARKAMILNSALYMFLISVILLIVLKIGG